MSGRWRVRPEGSAWGDYGADDQIGRLNLLTPERRRSAAREVRTGHAFVLSLPLDLPGPGLQPPFRQPPALAETAGHHRPFAELFGIPGVVDIGCDDTVTLNTQYSTQWDALSHVGALFDVSDTGTPEPVYFNGYRAGVEVAAPGDGVTPGARRLGIETMAESGLQGRGVLVDLLAACGDARTAVGYDTLMAAMEAQDVVVEAGDILCVHTGFAGALLAAGGAPDGLLGSFAALDGHDPALLSWITNSGIAALVADNVGVEGLAPEHVRPGEPLLPLHHHCLFKLGLPLGELWHLSALAAWLGEHGRSRFLLTAPPLRLPGAVGSPVTPVATV